MRREMKERVVTVLAAGLWLLILAGPAGAGEYPAHVGLGGGSGLINIPSATVLPEGVMRFGFSVYHARVAYEGRGRSDNEVYHLSFGLFPRVEVSLRATVFPDLRLIEGDDPTVDRMASGRILLLTEAKHRPALIVGMDDPRGTRRFHALYVAGGKTIPLLDDRLGLRVTGGFGSRALNAMRHILDGGFGGVEVLAGTYGALSLEHDTRKWNVGWGVRIGSRASLRVALLDWETASGGLAWEQPLGF